jgi:hypothetical protein
MTEISTCGEAKGSALVPLPTNDASERNGGSTLLCAPQGKIEITFDDEGNAELIQSAWPDENQIIRISRDNIGSFLDRLTDAFGVPSIGGRE